MCEYLEGLLEDIKCGRSPLTLKDFEEKCTRAYHVGSLSDSDYGWLLFIM